MRPIATLLILLFGAPTFAQRAALFDELEPLFPDGGVSAGSSSFTSDTARGVPVGVHVLVSGLAPNATVTWSLGGVASARAFRLHAVPVEQNTGRSSRTEAFDGRRNPHVIRRAPFHVFEVLEPIADRATADENGVLCLRVEIPVPVAAEVGPDEATLRLECGEWSRELRWRRRVHAATVPPRSTRQRAFTNWFDPLAMAHRHGLEPWSEGHFLLLARYADLMARCRQDTFWIRWRDFVLFEEGRPRVERDRLARYIDIFVRRGFIRIESGHLARRHRDDWNSPRLDLALTGSDLRTEAGAEELAALLALLKELCAAFPAGLEVVQHITDEPTDVNAETYRRLADRVRAELPGVRIFDATMSRSLVGAVDDWCPQVQEYQSNRRFFRARQAAGNEVWVYTCLAPGGPWLNRLLDQERLRPVYLGWALVRYDLRGFLHWGLNHTRPGVDPFAQSVVPHGGGPPNFLPAGDSHVVYPGDDGPWSGQRFEAHRIGMEDAALLDQVRVRDPRTARCIADQVLHAFDDYAKDVASYRRAKLDLLRAASGERLRYLRVLTYNIHHGEGTDGAFDYERLARVLRDADPDLVALQEVDCGTNRVRGIDQPKVLGGLLGFHHAFGEAMPYDGGRYGEAVLSRFPFASTSTHPLGCAPGQEPRAALSVVVKPWGEDGPEVQLTGTHLCHQSEDTRLRQVGELEETLAPWKGPAVLAGDFNFEPHSAPYRKLAQTWRDAARALRQESPTFPAERGPEPRRRIDFVWLRDGSPLAPRSVRAIEEPVASDHLPVLAILVLEER